MAAIIKYKFHIKSKVKIYAWNLISVLLKFAYFYMHRDRNLNKTNSYFHSSHTVKYTKLVTKY